MTTVGDLINSSLRVVGVLGAGETAASQDTDLAFDVLKLLLQEWSDGGLSVPSVVQEAITLAASKSSYTIGEDGTPDKDTVRPEQIIGAWVRDSSNYDYPVNIIGEKAYRLIHSKTNSARPDRLWYNPTAPNGTIYVWPTPDATESLYISSIKPFTLPSTLTEDVLNTTTIPSNYHNPLKWNLALELCAEFEREPTALIISRAQKGYQNIQALTLARRMEPTTLEISPESGSNRNILTG